MPHRLSERGSVAGEEHQFPGGRPTPGDQQSQQGQTNRRGDQQRREEGGPGSELHREPTKAALSVGYSRTFFRCVYVCRCSYMRLFYALLRTFQCACDYSCSAHKSMMLAVPDPFPDFWEATPDYSPVGGVARMKTNAHLEIATSPPAS